ncbi:class I SAM-dependent methyltransferase [Brevundimonas sp.]
MSQAEFAPSLSGRPSTRRSGGGLSILGLIAALWRAGGLTLVDPAGRPRRIGDTSGPACDDPVWRMQRWRGVRRLITRGDIGFAEGYVAGDWDTPDLTALLVAFADNYDHLEKIIGGNPLARGLDAILHALTPNTRRGSRRNIIAHYDLGNDFYAGWLDAGMTYSAALFEAPDQALEDAQSAKYAALADACDIRPGQSVLEIGCGWGGFAEYLARERGATVTAITLSPSQKSYAEQRIRRAGLSDRVSIELIDYRDVRGAFDRIVSVEMFEAVGEAYWPTFFQTLRDRLTPDGRAALQIITIRDALLPVYRRRPDFIQMHVFPGGMLPSEERLQAVTGKTGLSAQVVRRFGRDYAETLRRWRVAFDAAGTDKGERFRRLWRYYLAYCEAGFLSGRIDVVHLTVEASGAAKAP